MSILNITLSKRLEPPQVDTDIIVSKLDENSIRFLEEALNDEKRYLTILTVKRNSRSKDKFGCRILCKDCEFFVCTVLQPFGYNKPKKIQCTKCGYVYFGIWKKSYNYLENLFPIPIIVNQEFSGIREHSAWEIWKNYFSNDFSLGFSYLQRDPQCT